MREKYLALVLGSEEMDLGDPFLLNAHHSLMGSVEKGMEYLDKKGFKRDGKPWDFSGKKNKKKQKEARVLLDKVLPAFATAYAYPGGKQSKNDYYQDEAMLSRVVDTLNYMNEKGWKPGFFIGLDYEELANAGHTGFGGSINNNITGYAKTLASPPSTIHSPDI